MDAQEIRRKRLREWIDKDFDGRTSALCKHHELPDSMASFISQLLSRHRNFGERAARNLEASCGKPQGWLDDSEIVENMPNPLDVNLKEVSALPVSERRKIEDFIGYVLAGHRRKVRMISANRVLSPSWGSQEIVSESMKKQPTSRPVIGTKKQGRRAKD